MSKFQKTIFGSIISIFSISFVVQAAEVYSWRDQSGNVVFSETKPTDSDIDYKVMQIGKPTVVETKSPKQSKDNTVKIDQSDINKLANSQLANENKEALEQGANTDFVVTITSPSEDQNMFSKEGEVPVITNPAIPSDAKPVFKVNGKEIPSQYENGNWTIPRPAPGTSKISVSGTTADGKNIVSENEATLRIFNGTIKQMQNTGNSRRAF